MVSAMTLREVSRHYVVGESLIKAVDSASLDVKDRDFVMVMGPSGSGKSTLLNLMAGLERPSQGEVSIDDVHLEGLSDNELCNIRRYRLGLIFQFFYLHPILSVQENVELPLLIAGIHRNIRAERAIELLELVGLEKRVDHMPHELSGGEKQRVGIARALGNDPPYILADEPTGDLDSVSGHKIMQLLRRLNQKMGKTLIVVSHDEKMLEPGMRLVRMADGRITDDETLTSSRIDEIIQDSFFYDKLS